MPLAVGQSYLIRPHSRGFHFIMPKRDNNIIMFLLKVRALVNSEEYGGDCCGAGGVYSVLRRFKNTKCFAMTDVECVCYRFSQPESFVKDVLWHIAKDGSTLYLFSVENMSELNFFLKLWKSYLVEGRFVGELLQFKVKELAFIPVALLFDYELSMLVYVIEIHG